jgi:hypothetical protein
VVSGSTAPLSDATLTAPVENHQTG